MPEHTQQNCYKSQLTDGDNLTHKHQLHFHPFHRIGASFENVFTLQ